MTKTLSTKYLILGMMVLAFVLGTVFLLVRRFGEMYQNDKANQELLDAQDKMRQDKYDIRRIRYTGPDGESVEILQNGTIISQNEAGRKQSVLGFSKLQSLFASFTESELAERASYGGQGAYLTIETKSGNTYIVYVDTNTDNEVTDLIDDIIDTVEDTFNPKTPIPSPVTTTPTPTPEGTALPPVLPTPTPLPTGSTPLPTNTPAPSLPAYMTAEPFDCSDYNLTKKAVISNIICEPSQ